MNVERLAINKGEWDKHCIFRRQWQLKFTEGIFSYTDKELFAGGSKFQYRLKQIDNDGSFEYSDVIEVEVVPDQFELITKLSKSV